MQQASLFTRWTGVALQLVGLQALQPSLSNLLNDYVKQTMQCHDDLYIFVAWPALLRHDSWAGSLANVDM
jgi:hypothetical protein